MGDNLIMVPGTWVSAQPNLPLGSIHQPDDIHWFQLVYFTYGDSVAIADGMLVYWDASTPDTTGWGVRATAPTVYTSSPTDLKNNKPAGVVWMQNLPLATRAAAGYGLILVRGIHPNLRVADAVTIHDLLTYTSASTTGIATTANQADASSYAEGEVYTDHANIIGVFGRALGTGASDGTYYRVKAWVNCM